MNLRLEESGSVVYLFFFQWENISVYINTILKDYSSNNHFRYGTYEVYPKENNYGIWLCGKVTQLNGLKESCIIN